MTLNAGQFPPEQLKLFMSATELQGTINRSYDGSMSTGGDGSGPDGLSKLWKLKLKESKRDDNSHGAGVYKEMKEHGWDTDRAKPGYGEINLYHRSKQGAIPEWNTQEKRIDDGNHRIAALAHIEGMKSGRDTHFIPVKHWET